MYLENAIKRKRAARRVFVMILSSILLVLAAAGAGHAGADAGPFREGSVRMSLMFGGATAFDKNYSLYGLGVGYYVIDRLEVGLDAETWQGNDPRIRTLSPQVRYVVPTDSTVKPYVGAFYTRTFISGYKDQDTAGGRAGAFFLTGGRAFFGAGLVHDIHLSCDHIVYSSCSDTYLELLLAVTF